MGAVHSSSTRRTCPQETTPVNTSLCRNKTQTHGDASCEGGHPQTRVPKEKPGGVRTSPIGGTNGATGLTHFLPALGVHVELHQGFQVTHLQVGFRGIARVPQLFEIEGTFGQRLTLSFIQLSSNFN